MYPYVLAHPHGLDTIEGYRVVVTIEPDGTRVWREVAYFDDSTSYRMALAEARSYRVGAAYARVVEVYSCGCSEDHETPSVVTA